MRRLVLTIAHVRASGRAWVAAVASHPDLAWALIRRTSYWVYDPDFDDFYPSKWAGFEEMTPTRYGSDEGGAAFQGTTARIAIEGAVGTPFAASPALTTRLSRWASARMSGVLEGTDVTKWWFVILPGASVESSRHGTDDTPPGDDSAVAAAFLAPPGFWASYEDSWTYYQRAWRVYNEVLYEMCAARPGHGSLGDVVAKVGIVARAYAAGLERHGDPEGPGAIVGVATLLHQHSDEVDTLIAELRRVAGTGDEFNAEIGSAVVAMHGKFEAIVRDATNNGHSVRSWSSKYLHFHAPGVPLYDSRARGVVKARYDLRRVRNQHFPSPDEGDYKYSQFVNAFLSLWVEASELGLPVTVRRLDQFLLWTADGE